MRVWINGERVDITVVIDGEAAKKGSVLTVDPAEFVQAGETEIKFVYSQADYARHRALYEEDKAFEVLVTGMPEEPARLIGLPFRKTVRIIGLDVFEGDGIVGGFKVLYKEDRPEGQGV